MRLRLHDVGGGSRPPTKNHARRGQFLISSAWKQRGTPGHSAAGGRPTPKPGLRTISQGAGSGRDRRHRSRRGLPRQFIQQVRARRSHEVAGRRLRRDARARAPSWAKMATSAVTEPPSAGAQTRGSSSFPPPVLHTPEYSPISPAGTAVHPPPPRPPPHNLQTAVQPHRPRSCCYLSDRFSLSPPQAAPRIRNRSPNFSPLSPVPRFRTPLAHFLPAAPPRLFQIPFDTFATRARSLLPPQPPTLPPAPRRSGNPALSLPAPAHHRLRRAPFPLPTGHASRSCTPRSPFTRSTVYFRSRRQRHPHIQRGRHQHCSHP